MKKTSIYLGILFIFGIANFAMAQGQKNRVIKSSASETQEMEKYKSEILIKGKWGNGPKEFGIFTKAIPDGPVGSTVRCPVTLDVSENGDIYIYMVKRGRF